LIRAFRGEKVPLRALRSRGVLWRFYPIFTKETRSHGENLWGSGDRVIG
jgi:hypothetical protein